MDSEEDEINDSFENRITQYGQLHEADTFNILIATDIHLGYKENDSIRGILNAIHCLKKNDL